MYYFCNMKKKETDAHTNEKQQQQEETKATVVKQLFLKVMKEGDAEPEELDENTYGFHYKDEYIIAEVGGDMMLRLTDYNWYAVNRWDVDAVTKVQSIINKNNIYEHTKMVYNYGDDDTMYVSTMIVVPFVEEIKDLTDLFVAMLSLLIISHSVLKGKPEDEGKAEAESGDKEGGEE